MKKLSILLIICTLLGVFSVQVVYAAYENTYINIGNQIEDIIGVAATQVGNTSGTKYNNPNNKSWCAYFIIWCARQAGIDSSVIKNTGWATSDDLLGAGRYHDKSTGYVPKRGDIIVYDWVSGGLCAKTPRSFYGDHVGIVTSADSSYVYTIEGNRSGKVQSVKTSLTDPNIKGYGAPNYKSGSVSAPDAPANLKATKAGEKAATISWTAGARATSYEIEWYSQNTKAWKKDTDYKNTSATSYTTTGLVNQTTKFRVRSVNSGGKSAWVEVNVTLSSSETTAPAGPSNIKSTKASAKSATISWTAGARATSYEIEWYSQNTKVWKKDTDYKNTSATTYTTTGLVNQTTKFRIRSANSVGKSAWVEFSVKI